MYLESPSILEKVDPSDQITEFNRRQNENNRKEASVAASFLDHSGINDLVLDFNSAYMQGRSSLRHELTTSKAHSDGKITKEAAANIAFDWISPESGRHLMFSIKAGRSRTGDKFLSTFFKDLGQVKAQASLVEPVSIVKVKNYDSKYDFEKKLTDRQKFEIRTWLSEILNENLLSY
jgi:hypothetical protein